MPTMWSPIATLPETRQGILMALKRRGESSADELAAALGLTSGAVRQQLSQMAHDGLVVRRADPGVRGRPRFVFTLTEAADVLFPNLYVSIAASLSAVLAHAGDEFTEAWRRSSLPGSELRQRLPGKPFSGQVQEFSDVLDELGFLADTTVEGAAARVSIYSCPLRRLAEEIPAICQVELDDIRIAADDAEVTRTAHMLGGQRTCDYVLRARTAAYRPAQAAGEPAA